MQGNLKSAGVGAGVGHFPSNDVRLMDGFVGAPLANAKGYFSITQQRRYHGLILDYASTTLALTSMSFTLKINGQIFQTYTGDQRAAWNNYDFGIDSPANTGQLWLPFMMSNEMDIRGSMLTSINLGPKYQAIPGGGEELRVEIALDGNPVDISKFDLYAVTSDVNPEQSVWLPRIDQWQETPGVGVNQAIKKRLTDQGDHTRREVSRFWLNDTAAHVTRIRILEDSDETYNLPTAAMNGCFGQIDAFHLPQADWQLWDGRAWGNPFQTIKSYDANSLQVFIDTAAGVANPLPIIVESFGSLT